MGIVVALATAALAAFGRAAVASEVDAEMPILAASPAPEIRRRAGHALGRQHALRLLRARPGRQPLPPPAVSALLRGSGRQSDHPPLELGSATRGAPRVGGGPARAVAVLFTGGVRRRRRGFTRVSLLDVSGRLPAQGVGPRLPRRRPGRMRCRSAQQPPPPCLWGPGWYAERTRRRLRRRPAASATGAMCPTSASRSATPPGRHINEPPPAGAKVVRRPNPGLRRGRNPHHRAAAGPGQLCWKCHRHRTRLGRAHRGAHRLRNAVHC